ncbi:hypothetical protein D3C71_1685590 [compost metagenome]
MRSCDHTSRLPCPGAGPARRNRPAGRPPASSVPAPGCAPARGPVRECHSGWRSTAGRAARAQSAACPRPGSASSTAGKGAVASASGAGRFRHPSPSNRQRSPVQGRRGAGAGDRPAVRRRPDAARRGCLGGVGAAADAVRSAGRSCQGPERGAGADKTRATPRWDVALAGILHSPR